jgi:hypothetical protein
VLLASEGTEVVCFSDGHALSVFAKNRTRVKVSIDVRSNPEKAWCVSRFVAEKRTSR